MRKFVPILALSLVLGGGIAIAQQADPEAVVTFGDGTIVEGVFPITIDTVAPATTTTTSPPTTTTTTSPPTTTTTTLAPELITGPCIDAQIARGGFGMFDDRPEFDIILNDLDANENLWVAPYAFDTFDNHGWISGDRAGYFGAYMFLVDKDDNAIVGRVTFLRVVGYGQVNDRYMAEIQTTQIGVFGQCGDGDLDQSQILELGLAGVEYVPYDGPDDRPLIFYVGPEGQIVEDRSYTNTEAGPGVKFRAIERSDSRVVVIGYKDNLPVIAVYYDVLDDRYMLAS